MSAAIKAGDLVRVLPNEYDEQDPGNGVVSTVEEIFRGGRVLDPVSGAGRSRNRASPAQGDPPRARARQQGSLGARAHVLITYAGIGARATPYDVLARMTSVAACLRAAGWHLRSGGAIGADTAFEEGAGTDATIVTVDKFRGLDPGRIKRAHEIAEAHHPAWAKCGAFARDLLARNVVVLLGPGLNDPVSLVLYWRPESATRGGTLHALRVASTWGIPALSIERDWNAIGKALEDEEMKI